LNALPARLFPVMNTISFMSANFVARELGYRMNCGWAQGDTSVQAFFRPEETFAERFGVMLDEVKALGFAAIDLWSGHLHPDWATDRQIGVAADLLRERSLTVSSLAVYLSGDEAALYRTGEIARAVGTSVLGGGCRPEWLGEKRAALLAFLKERDLRWGFENHPEKSALEVLAKIGDSGEDRIGVAIDTGWFGSQGFPAADAIRTFGNRLVHVHLKDIRPPMTTGDERDIREGAPVTLKEIGHETCVLGDGCVGIAECVRALKEIGYRGGISIEHEPEDRSPADDVRVSLARLHEWLGRNEGDQ